MQLTSSCVHLSVLMCICSEVDRQAGGSTVQLYRAKLNAVTVESSQYDIRNISNTNCLSNTNISTNSPHLV